MHFGSWKKLHYWDFNNDSTNVEFPHLRVHRPKSTYLSGNHAGGNRVMRGLGVSYKKEKLYTVQRYSCFFTVSGKENGCPGGYHSSDHNRW